MTPFKYHVFVCEQQKPDGAPCCSARGAAKTMDALRREVAAQGLADAVQITSCGSLGVCERGPNMVVYPEGVWYSGVSPEDVREIVREHFVNGKPVERLQNRDADALKAEIKGNRERYLAALRAKDAAGLLPDNLMQTMRAFQESRPLLTAIELDVFSAVGQGARAAEVASRIGADERATAMLLNALVSLEALEKHGEVYRNTPVSARYLAAGGQNDARAAMMHTVHLWDTWSTLTDCVRAGTSVMRLQAGERSSDWTEAFVAAMHHNAAGRAPALAQAMSDRPVRKMLDVGGGSGAYSIAFAKANPELTADILDLAPVLELTRTYVEQAGLGGRIRLRPGDLTKDNFGSGYDLVLISAICHMLGPDENKNLLERAHDALVPGGRVVIQDFLLDADKTGPKQAALFALNMLVATRNGNAYSEQEYADWLRAAGFDRVERVRVPGPAGIMAGTRS